MWLVMNHCATVLGNTYYKCIIYQISKAIIGCRICSIMQFTMGKTKIKSSCNIHMCNNYNIYQQFNAYLLPAPPTVSPQLHGYRGDLIGRSSLRVNWIYTDRAVHTPCCQAHSVWMECQTTNRTNPWPHETFMIFYCVKSWPLHIVDSYVLVHRATEKKQIIKYHLHELGHLPCSGFQT